MTAGNGDRFDLDIGRSIQIIRTRGGSMEERLEFPYPNAGIGGGSLTLSPSERLLLFSYFSGQSEEAYRLISTGPNLRQLGSCEYLSGEAASYAFSPDEQLMLLALPASCTPRERAELEKDASGNLFLEFGRLRVHRIADDVATQHSICVYFDEAWEPNRDDYDAELYPEINNQGDVKITLPWETINLAAPISDIVELHIGGHEIRFYSVGEEYGCFSNFAPYPIRLAGKSWPTSEHYFQAQKFDNEEHREAIRKAKSPMIAARMGRDRKKKLRRDWEAVKVAVMTDAVRAKFAQHDDLRAVLLGTGDAKIVEHTANDAYWGDGGDGSGINMLGQVLMRVRAEVAAGGNEQRRDN
ncbi:MAG TPA: NADAR family protein [Pirellulales bacterium]